MSNAKANDSTEQTSGLPLEGVTVISIEQAIAAPFASRQLADLGARIIKVERPDGGDFARYYDDKVRGLSSQFVWTNRSKESLTLNLKSEPGIQVLHELLQRADVLIQNLSPGALERLGIKVPSLRSRYPSLIICSISGYGATGPYHDRKAYDLLIQAEAGLLSITGGDDFPSKAGIAVADIAAGMYAYSGILSALYHRHKTGSGCHLEVSLLDSLGEWMGYPIYYTMFGGQTLPRTEAHHATIAPYGPYTAADGETVLLAVQNATEWKSFCESVLEAPELEIDVKFATNPLRVRHRDLLDQEIKSRLRAMRSDELLSRLSHANIAFGIARDMESVASHPQLISRERWRNIPTPVGEIRALIPPVISDTFMPQLGGVPELGANTDALLSELGYDVAEIEGLRTQGCV